jgi:hypothetical protein
MTIQTKRKNNEKNNLRFRNIKRFRNIGLQRNIIIIHMCHC